MEDIAQLWKRVPYPLFFHLLPVCGDALPARLTTNKKPVLKLHLIVFEPPPPHSMLTRWGIGKHCILHGV